MVHGEAEFFHHHIARRRGAESLYADDVAAVADITMPTLRQSRLHGEPRPNRRRQDRFAILARLQVEQFPARHGNDARLNFLLR